MSYSKNISKSVSYNSAIKSNFSKFLCHVWKSLKCVIMKPCSLVRQPSLPRSLKEDVAIAGKQQTHNTGLLRLTGYTKEFKEFMALSGDGAPALSGPSSLSLLELFPLYWPIKEPSSLNCPSPPSP